MDSLQCLPVIKAPNKTPKRRAISSWTILAAGEVKFNVDGASLGKPGQAGIGGVLRDHQGNVIIRFSRSVGVADSNLLELMAVKEAFILFLSCSRLHSYILNIESDSRHVVCWVLKPHTTPWRVRHINSHIENLKQQMKDWRIGHIFSELNCR
ncbi:hypothetical protein DITRI_Ditri04bG0039600 [Diplodiscus trichospermus]